MSRHHPLLVLLLLCLAGCSSLGAFLNTNDGPLFTPHPPDEDHAVVYLYRPQSDWADQELEAPGLFLNKRLIGSLPSNSYLVLELDRWKCVARCLARSGPCWPMARWTSTASLASTWM